MGWRRRLQQQREDILPEDFATPTAREERISALHHFEANINERRAVGARMLLGVSALDTLITSPLIFDQKVLFGLGIVGVAASGVASWHYQSLSNIERFTANAGPQPQQPPQNETNS